ncbi:MAG: hypothetical protein JWP76_735 [Dactylosporangium sp.]|nr:hypothetical protein [Dactylosporangium sp.]
MAAVKRLETTGRGCHDGPSCCCDCPTWHSRGRRSPTPSTLYWPTSESPSARSRREARGRTPTRNGSCSPPAARSPTTCSSSADDIYAEHSVNMPVTTTVAVHIGRCSCCPRAPTARRPDCPAFCRVPAQRPDQTAVDEPGVHTCRGRASAARGKAGRRLPALWRSRLLIEAYGDPTTTDRRTWSSIHVRHGSHPAQWAALMTDQRLNGTSQRPQYRAVVAATRAFRSSATRTATCPLNEPLAAVTRERSRT